MRQHVSALSIDFSAPPVVDRAQRRALIVGAIGAVLCLIAAVVDWHHFLRAYLVGYMMFLGLSLGCLSLLLLQNLTGGQWGLVLRRQFQAASLVLIPMAVLFLPIAFGVHELYHWSHAEAVAHDGILQAKAPYLNIPFWIARAVLYFAVWIGLALLLTRWSRVQDERPADYRHSRMATLSGPGIVIYVLAVTFASVDWVMSLNPHWFSTMFGLLYVAGFVLAAMAFCILVTAMLTPYEPMSMVIRKRHMHDLGKLMLAFVMLWAYLNFSQFLIIWSGNVPEETPWYITRLEHGWQWISIALLVFHFIVPFVLLLSRDLKVNMRTISAIAILILVMRVVDLAWTIVPNFNYEGAPQTHAHPLATASYLFAPLAIGGIWFYMFLGQLKKRPLMPFNDPHLPAAMEPDHGGH